MSNQENKDRIGNYQLKKTIGEGTFGKVKLAIHLPTKEYVAIKILEKCCINDKDEFERIKKESCVEEKEEVVRIPLRTRKEKVDRRKVAKIIAGALLLVSLTYGVSKVITAPSEGQIYKNLSSISNPSEETGIVNRNTYTLCYDDRGMPITAINHKGIAAEIEKIASTHPELLDVSIYSVYNNLNTNILANMDMVVNELNKKGILGKGEEGYIFLDYLDDLGFVNDDNKGLEAKYRDCMADDFKRNAERPPFYKLEKAHSDILYNI